MKRWIILFISAFLIIIVSSCGGKSGADEGLVLSATESEEIRETPSQTPQTETYEEEDPFYGTWYAEYFGQTITGLTFRRDGIGVALKDKDKYVFQWKITDGPEDNGTGAVVYQVMLSSDDIGSMEGEIRYFSDDEMDMKLWTGEENYYFFYDDKDENALFRVQSDNFFQLEPKNVSIPANALENMDAVAYALMDGMITDTESFWNTIWRYFIYYRKTIGNRNHTMETDEDSFFYVSKRDVVDAAYACDPNFNGLLVHQFPHTRNVQVVYDEEREKYGFLDVGLEGSVEILSSDYSNNGNEATATYEYSSGALDPGWIFTVRYVANPYVNTEAETPLYYRMNTVKTSKT